MSIGSEKEMQQLKKRFQDLAEKAYRQNVYAFSGFLGLSEQNAFWQGAGRVFPESGGEQAGSVSEKDRYYRSERYSVPFALWGGAEGADRKMARFGSPEELGYEQPYPISCVHIRPLSVKFAEPLSHRDFLGALMNLGIERSTLGDVRVGEKEAWLFCLDSIAPFVCDNLTQVRHTHVSCEPAAEAADIPEEEPAEEMLVVSSLRADALLAGIYKLSRTDSLNAFRMGKVYVNGQLCENNSRALKENDVVNLRGKGKFIFRGVGYETRKGKLSVTVQVYR